MYLLEVIMLLMFQKSCLRWDVIIIETRKIGFLCATVSVNLIRDEITFDNLNIFPRVRRSALTMKTSCDENKLKTSYK